MGSLYAHMLREVLTFQESRRFAHRIMKLLSLVALLVLVGVVTCDPYINGTWSSVQSWPFLTIHMVMLKNGKVLSYGTLNSGRPFLPDEEFYYDVWDPATNEHNTVTYYGGPKGNNLFCSGQVQLPSGQVLITGGSENMNDIPNYGIAHVQFFDPETDTIELADHNMYFPRWYPSVTTLGNGQVVVQGGRGDTEPKIGITTPEVYNPETGVWKMLTAANNTLYRQRQGWWYPKSYCARQNMVLLFPAQRNEIWKLDHRGDGSLTQVATVPGLAFMKEAPACMFDRNKILAIQGMQDACVLDINNPDAPTYEKTGSLRERRIWATSVALPNGEVLVVGGASVSQELDAAVKYAEIWNPTTGQWRVGAEAAKARLYHSAAMLLPDATVLVGGGGRPGPVNNEDIEIYSPPYLFQANGDRATRPIITSLSTSEPDYGDTIQVTFQDATKIDRVSFIRAGSVTHSFNMDERMFSLEYTQNGNVLDVDLSFGRSVAPPGWYMLFIINDEGVPSEAKFVGLPSP